MTSIPARSPRPRILVLDDDHRTPIIIRGTGTLGQTSFDLDVARDPATALLKLKDGRYPLAVVSADLSSMGGDWRALIRTLRQNGLTAPVILLSRGASFSTDVARELGIRDHLRKPLLAPAIREAMRSALAEPSKPAAPLSTPAQARPIAPPPMVEPLSVLVALSRSINSSIGLEAVLQRLVEASVLLTRAEQGSLMLLDRESGVLSMRAAKNFDENFARTLRLRTDDSIAGQVVRTGKPLILGGPAKTKIKTQFLVKAAVYVPVRIQNETIGVLSVDNQHLSGTFTQRDQQLLMAVADLAAMALANHRLGRIADDQAALLNQALNEIESFQETQEQMIQNLSHELRTPLIFIKGFADLAVGGDLGHLPADILQGMQTVQKKANELVRIIENVVTLGEEKEAPLKVDSVPLEPLMQAVLDRYRPAAERANVVMVADLPDEPVWVMVDRPKLELALNNLIENAIKFSPNGGLVTVSAGPGKTGHVEIVVSDTGVGIPTDKLDRIFQRFYQVDGSATRRYGGLGIGLASARQIIRGHGGGDLAVESRPGEGSIFRFQVYAGEPVSKVAQ